MAVIKIACEKCGQRVSGDETFLGKSVECPVCGHKILFPVAGEKVPELPKRASSPADIPADRAQKTGPVDEDGGASAIPEKKESVASGRPSAPVIPPENAAADGPTEKPPPPKPDIPKPDTQRRTETLSTAPIAAGTAARGERRSLSEPTRPSGAAVWSAIFGVTTYILFPIGFLFALLAILCGHAGRSNVRRAHGRLSGGGLANLGLMLSYSYIIILFFAAILVPWRPLLAFGIQKYNAGSASVLVTALDRYADDHAGNFPPKLIELAPAYLEPARLEALRWIDPTTFEFPLSFESHAFRYYGGHNRENDPDVVLLSSPQADAADLRVVARVGYTVELVHESEFVLQVPETPATKETPETKETPATKETMEE
ncbi:MAG: hypothetical protein ACC661_00165 [Verrucomicrobiales bacterium]